MERPQVKITQDDIERNTDTAVHYGEGSVLHALEFLRDPRKKERKAACNCRFCYYLRGTRIGGAAMTTQPCGICSKDVMYGSTCTDKLCKECADEYKLCRYCGGDIDMIRRKNRKELP
jgi:hypothetical protein